MSPRLPIEGTHNFRDLGGYPAAGGVTRAGQVFRSDALSAVTPAGAEQLAGLGIGVVVDLRSPLECRQDRAEPALPEAVRVHLPIHGGSRSSLIEGEPFTLEALYRQVLRDSAWSLSTAVAVVAESGEVPVLVHCTAGKDRTGLAVALVLEAAGVAREAVVADYAQSALNLDGEWLDQTLTSLVSRGVPVSPRLFEVLGGSPDHVMTRVLGWLDAEYGSAVGYLRAHGLPEGTPAELRRKLVRR